MMAARQRPSEFSVMTPLCRGCSLPSLQFAALEVWLSPGTFLSSLSESSPALHERISQLTRL